MSRTVHWRAAKPPSTVIHAGWLVRRRAGRDGLATLMTERITRQKVAPTKRLLALGLTVTLSFAAICGWVLWHAGDRDYLHSRAAATNLVSSLASEIERNIELYDLSLQAAVDGMKLPDINRISRELRQVVLFDRAATAKDMGAILV